MAKKSSGCRPFYSSEFTLVFVLILALLVTIGIIFIFSSGTDRKDLLAIILGAFGAWIGAGAAYFFGRENMDSATESMLKMRMTPQDILNNTPLRSMKYSPIPRTFTKDDLIKTVLEWFQEDPERFFAVLLTDKETVDKTMHLEAVSRYLLDDKNKADKEKDTLARVIDYITTKSKEKDGKNARSWDCLLNVAEQIEDWQSAAVANMIMEKGNRRVAILVDNKKKLLGYITTASIRRLMLQTTD
jgi:hypothetical protein